jgi:hypothetical protein
MVLKGPLVGGSQIQWNYSQTPEPQLFKNKSKRRSSIQVVMETSKVPDAVPELFAFWRARFGEDSTALGVLRFVGCFGVDFADALSFRMQRP